MKTLLVMSGKGGVGKTTLSTNIAQQLAKTENQVGILDADIHGPNVLELLGVKNPEIFSENNKLIPIKVNNNLKAVSIAALIEESAATIWRGPMKHKFIKQLIEDVDWEKLDYLIVDFPPGTGDEHISAVQLLKNISGTIIISTPQNISLADVKRSIDFCKKMNVPIIGIIENMSGEIFGEGSVKTFCEGENINFLGTIPLDKEIATAGEEGKPFFEKEKLKKNFSKIISKILEKVKK